MATSSRTSKRVRRMTRRAIWFLNERQALRRRGILRHARNDGGEQGRSGVNRGGDDERIVLGLSLTLCSGSRGGEALRMLARAQRRVPIDRASVPPRPGSFQYVAPQRVPFASGTPSPTW